jgi:hypothetical protein
MAEGDDVELLVGCSTDPRPESRSFLIVLSLLDPNSKCPRFEVKEQIADVELHEF